ncbi:MAG: alkaline phosphatase family protein [bacterium]
MKFNHDSIIPRKVLFVGIDGATYWLVEKMIAVGKLPNISRLIQTGSTFRVETQEPVISPCVWTSIATGKKPDKHGVKSFFASSSSVATKRIWEIFQDHDLSVGIMGYFVTWPPQEVNGFMIPDLLALDNQTYPKEYGFLHDITDNYKKGKNTSYLKLIKYAWSSIKYGIQVHNLLATALILMKKKIVKPDLLNYLYEIRVLKQKLYSDLFIALYKKYNPTFAYFHNHLLDYCSHSFWRYMEPEKFDDVSEQEITQYGTKLFDAYSEADKTLGKILKIADKNTLLVVASDHGLKAAANPNVQWRQPNINSELLMNYLGIENEVSFSNVGYDIVVKPRVERPGAKKKLKRTFESITMVEEQLPLFQILEYDTSNLWLRLNNSIQKIDGCNIKWQDDIRPLDDFIQTTEIRSSGVHDGKNAILIFNGFGVKQGKKFLNSPAEVFDIIPTILALMNMPIGKDMDGRALTEAIAEDFLIKYPVSYIESYDDSNLTSEATPDMVANEKLKNQLRALGYL